MSFRRLALAVVCLLAGCATGTNPPAPAPQFYLHAGTSGFTDAGEFVPKETFCSQMALNQPISVFVDEATPQNPWKHTQVTGQVSQRDHKVFADLTWATSAQSQFYRGEMRLEEPFFALGGAASGGAGPRMWFVVSADPSTNAVLKKITRLYLRQKK